MCGVLEVKKEHSQSEVAGDAGPLRAGLLQVVPMAQVALLERRKKAALVVVSRSEMATCLVLPLHLPQTGAAEAGVVHAQGLPLHACLRQEPVPRPAHKRYIT